MGVDGCPGGWAVAESADGRHDLRLYVVVHLAEVLARAAAGEARVVIDMPIGLPETGPRRCDQLARRAIGRRLASSVFPAPVRAVLDAPHAYAATCAASVHVSGRRLSVQTFHLLPRIRALDAWITPARQAMVQEGHPELTFSLLHGAPLLLSKHTAEGRALRHDLLLGAGLAFDLAAARRAVPARVAAEDDLLDAAACLVAARRVAEGLAVVLPPDVRDCDARGLRMSIVG